MPRNTKHSFLTMAIAIKTFSQLKRFSCIKKQDIHSGANIKEIGTASNKSQDMWATTSQKNTIKNTYKQSNHQESSKDITCYLCNQKGHIKSQCSKNKNKEINIQTRRVSNFSLHVRNSNLKLLRYWARINGERVGVVFDTAANLLVLKDCATKLNIRVKHENRRLKLR